jgi:hypothetical protein
MDRRGRERLDRRRVALRTNPLDARAILFSKRYTVWQPADDELLLKMAAAGKSSYAIGAALQRSTAAVRMRLNKLRRERRRRVSIEGVAS